MEDIIADCDAQDDRVSALLSLSAKMAADKKAWMAKRLAGGAARRARLNNDDAKRERQRQRAAVAALFVALFGQVGEGGTCSWPHCPWAPRRRGGTG